MTIIIERRTFDPSDARLGRHVAHDPRSRDYAVEQLVKLQSVRHRSKIGILDQGRLGSCTGNAAVKCISHTGFWPKASTVLTADLDVDEDYAVGVYSDATRIDDARGTYPPTDTGSSGLAVAKVLQRRGLIAGYQHAFTLEAALSAITKQTVIAGIPWYSGMFDPDPDGFIYPTGQIEGGHEICIDEINVAGRYVEFPNSWGVSWGLKGRARIRWDDLGDLLADDGDVTVFTAIKAG